MKSSRLRLTLKLQAKSQLLPLNLPPALLMGASAAIADFPLHLSSLLVVREVSVDA
jgi:hypothetical protein